MSTPTEHLAGAGLVLTRLNHPGRPAPTTQFSESTIVPGNCRLLVTSGQVGTMPDGRLAETIEEQVEHSWRNLLLLIRAAGSTPDQIVKTTAYLTDAKDVAVYRRIRNRAIPDVTASSTLVIVSGLAEPGYRVEVEAVVAVPDY